MLFIEVEITTKKNQPVELKIVVKVKQEMKREKRRARVSLFFSSLVKLFDSLKHRYI